MMAPDTPGGIISAVLTPFDAQLRPDARKAIPYYRGLLEQGCDALNILGTTGEAMSLGLSERLAFMEQIAQALPRERLMVGTGACALADAVRLTRAAFELNYACALLIPPFYYRDVSDDGIVAYFDALLERVSPPPYGIMLYNFPQMSGITFHPDLVDRLVKEFPSVIRGLKDSSNTLSLERDIHARHPDLRIFPGSEILLRQARDFGLAGCISGSVCLWPQAAARAWHEGQAADCTQVAALRQTLNGGPFVPMVRARVARQNGDVGWLRSLPPVAGGDAVEPQRAQETYTT